MIREEDQVFAKVVARHNLLPPEAIAEGMRALESSERSLKEILVERGLLTRAQVRELERIASRVMQGGPIPGYELVERIGRGGMGAVYRAKQLSMGGRTVALKVVRLPREHDRKNARRLLQEAKIVGKLDHPNIVKGYDVGVAADYVYFVMELVEGESLRDVLGRRRLEPFEALTITRKVASALAHAHESGFVHRDVKPGNILITEEGVPKLTDLGLAKSPRDSTLTRSGATLGTPQYISPEQAKSPRAADARSDIYSLGATLYHMVTGIPPYQGDTLASVISQVLFEEYVPPEDLNPALGDDLCVLIDKMMLKDPARRYPDAAALMNDIDAVLAGESIGPVPDEVATADSPRWSSVAGIAVIVAMLALGGFLLMREGGRGQSSGPRDMSEADGMALAAAAAIRETDRAHPFSSLRPNTIFAAFDAWSTLADAFPGSRATAVAADRVKALESRFEQLLDHYEIERLEHARGLLQRGEPRSARKQLRDASGAHFRQRFARGRGEIPRDWAERVELWRSKSLKTLDGEISRTVADGLIGRLDDGLEGAASPSDTLAWCDAVRGELDAGADLLDAEDRSRVADRVDSERERARLALEAQFEKELAAARERASAGRIRVAVGKAEEVATRAETAGIDLESELTETRQAIERHRLRGIDERLAESESAIADARRLHAERRPSEAIERLVQARRALDTGAEELAGPTDVENAGLAAEAERVRGFVVGSRLIDGFWQGIRERLALKIGSEVRLAFDNTAIRVIPVEVRDDVIRFRSAAGGEVQERDLRDLRRKEALDLGSPRTEGADGWVAVGWFLLAEAWGVPYEGRDVVLDEAQERFDQGREGARTRGILTGELVFAAFLDEARKSTEVERDSARSTALVLLVESDEDFAAGRWRDARDGYGRLLEEAAFRRALLPSERDRVRQDDATAERKIELAALASSFSGQVEFIDERTRTLRVTYDFQDPSELEDWDRGPGWEIVEGVLWEKPRAAGIRGRKGLVHRKEFETLADLTLEVQLVTARLSPPPRLDFLLFSMHENSFGWMYSDERLGARQLNFFAGSIDEFEKAFIPADPTAGAPLGHRPPAGLVLRDVPELSPGKRIDARLELRGRGREFRFRVDGQTWYERKLASVRKRGPLEIRSHVPHGYARIVIEGRLRR